MYKNFNVNATPVTTYRSYYLRYLLYLYYIIYIYYYYLSLKQVPAYNITFLRSYVEA